jgi:hypothetical protein
MLVRHASAVTHPDKYPHPHSTRDVFVVPDLFREPDMYDRLLEEMRASHVPEDRLFKLWHGDSHWIADDRAGWKKDAPVFAGIIKRLEEYFGMNIQATRFNWYEDSSHWKPYHHDAAAVKPHIAKIQNSTVAVSFGAQREGAFQHARNRSVVSFPLPSGSVYGFNQRLNKEWRHGILPHREGRTTALPDEPEGRISIIAWGWIDQHEES